MSAPWERQGEVLRLARVLGVEPAELDVLDGADAAALRELRFAVADRLLERNRANFERAVAFADHVPVGLAAKLSQHAMGPVLGGRAAALLTPEKAGELARRLPADYLAEVACHVDLRHVGPLLTEISPDTMAGAGKHLREREEWIVLGAFVGVVEDEKLEVLLDAFDGEALLRAGGVIEEPARVEVTVAMLSDQRLTELVHAADEHDLWVEAIGLVALLSAEQMHRVAEVLEALPAEQQDRLLATLDADPELAATVDGILDDLPELRERLDAVRADGAGA